MPSLDLSEEEAARLALALCICGCGESLPSRPGWNGQPVVEGGRRTAQNRCRKRLLRRRQNEGRSITRKERERLAIVAEADKLIADAEEDERRARSLLNTATQGRNIAAQLYAKAHEARQVSIPFLEATGAEGVAFLEGVVPSRPTARRNRKAAGQRPMRRIAVQSA